MQMIISYQFFCLFNVIELKFNFLQVDKKSDQEHTGQGRYQRRG